MNTVENRIVHMTFDNKKFEHDIATTIASIEKLKTTLDFSKVKQSFGDISNFKMSLDTSAFDRNIAEALGNTKKLRESLDFGAASHGMSQFADAAKGFHLNNMITAVDGVSKKFLTLGTIAITTLATITSHAVTAGLQMVQGLTFGPIMDGFREMETNMNSIQTILANTQSKGSTLEDVNKALAQLNEYSDKTIYNFSQMARNIGTFTAAGISLEQSVGAIKGIANLAAISGSNSEQASSAMYQLSQALAAGKVRMIDWISVRNAGLGGEVFKTALFETGKALGKLGDVPMSQSFKEWTDAGNSFEESLKDDWLTAEVLTNTLQAFTGDLTTAQLTAMGYTEEQAKEMQRLGALGVASATEVKTLTGLIDTLKESVASGWGKTFTLLFGDFEEAKSLFTGLSNAIGGFIQRNADARNKVLGDWKDLGGRTVLIAGIKNAFDALAFVAKQVKIAFKDLFPDITGRRLFELSVQFRDFMGRVEQFVQRHGSDLRDMFGGLASAMAILIEIGKQTIDLVKDLFYQLTGGTAAADAVGFLADIGNTITEWKEKLVDEGGIADFFAKISEAIKDPAKFIDLFKDRLVELKDEFINFFKNIDFGSIDGLVEGFQKIKDKIGEVLASIGSKIGVPQGLIDFFKSFGDTVDSNTTNSLAGGFERLGDALSTVWDIAKKIWDVFKTIGNALEWAWDKFLRFKDIVGQALSAVFDVVKNLGPTLQTAIKSEEFDRVLDMIDSLALLLGAKGLNSLGANGLKFSGDLTGGFLPELAKGVGQSGSLIGALKLNLDALTGTLKAMTTQIKSKALLQIAQAIGILTVSVLVLSMIDPDALAKSLGALAVGFGQLIGAVGLLSVLSSGPSGHVKMAALAGGMILLSTAVLILSAAVRVLSGLSWEEIGKGLAAVEGIMVIMATNANILSGSSASLISAGVGMIAIATALVIFGGAMKVFATMSWQEIGKGLVTIAGGLVLIAGAMEIMPASGIITGPAFIAFAVGLTILAGAMKIFATLSWEDIGKGMVAIGGGLVLIAGAMNLMPVSSILSGPALIAVAFALTILGGALKIFATMSWEDIGKSMVVLAGSLIILAGGLEMMTGAIGGAIALGIAAVSLMLFTKVLKGFAALSWKDLGRGLLVMGISLAALGVAATILQPALPALFGLAAALALLGVGFALIGVGAGLLAEAFQIIAAAGTAGIDVLMYAIDQLLVRIPELVTGFTGGVIIAFQQILDALPAMIDSLVKIIGALLEGLIELTPQFKELATHYIGAFLEVIRNSTPDLVKTGLQLILDLLKGIRDNIEEIVEVGITIIVNIIKGITNALPEFIEAIVNLIDTLIEEIDNHIDEILGAGLDLIVTLALGITENISEIVEAVAEIIGAFIKEMGESALEITKAGTDALIAFLSGLTEDTTEIVKSVGELVTNFMDALADEFVNVVDRAAKIVIDFLNDLAEVIRENDDKMGDAMANLGIAIIEGMIVGLKSASGRLISELKKIAVEAVKEIGKPWEWFSPSHTMIRLGNDIIEGLIIGLNEDSRNLNRTALAVSENAISSFQKAMSDASFNMERMNEFNPTITPVLDLTNVKTQAGLLSDILGQPTLQTGVSLDAATVLSAETTQAREGETTETESPAPKEIKFEQNNYSPEALNSAKIYRQTKNLIVLTKEELGVT